MAAFEGPDVPLMIAVTIDCHDVDRLLAFYAELLGIDNGGRHDHFGFLGHAPDRKVAIWLQEVPEAKQVKNRVHLDFAVPDLEAAERRVVALGGSLGERHEWRGYRWRTCVDPQGNEFDVMAADPVAERER
jgi:predicted enzyme related to lactoylglutathione lyase